MKIYYFNQRTSLTFKFCMIWPISFPTSLPVLGLLQSQCVLAVPSTPSLSLGPLHLLFPLPEMFSPQNIYMVCPLISMSPLKCHFFRTSSLTTISKIKLTLTLPLCPALLLFFIIFIILNIILHDSIF